MARWMVSLHNDSNRLGTHTLSLSLTNSNTDMIVETVWCFELGVSNLPHYGDRER